jgi:hypothetical protein
MKNVLFIHGFGGGVYEYRPIQKFLKDKFGDQIAFYEFAYKEKFGQKELGFIADKLTKYIDEKLKDKRFCVIAFSQGGIIWRIYESQNHSLNNCTDKVITICTPHNGSWLAYIFGFFLPGVRDLKPDSLLLQKLNNQKTNLKYYSIYNPLDLMVFPGTNAIFDQAVINKRVCDIGHMFTFWNKKTLNFVKEVLEFQACQ